MMYVQCELRKGNIVDVSWIEEKFAKIGKEIMRKNESNEWEDGWVVTNTWGKIAEEHAKKIRDLYKHHRKGTDI